MVSVWYPATPSDGPRAQYMTPAESRLLLAGAGITGVAPDVLSTVATNAVSDAKPAGHQRTHPLAVLSPGFTNPRRALTALAEDRPAPARPAASPAGRAVTTLRRSHVLFPGTKPKGPMLTGLLLEQTCKFAL
jgi:hypothetical protein